jgi:hypothetical protein
MLRGAPQSDPHVDAAEPWEALAHDAADLAASGDVGGDGMRAPVVSKQPVGSTGHVPFDNAGLPGFQFLQDRIPGTGGHTDLDFLDAIQADDLTKNAVVMASFACRAAINGTLVPRKTGRQEDRLPR